MLTQAQELQDNIELLEAVSEVDAMPTDREGKEISFFDASVSAFLVQPLENAGVKVLEELRVEFVRKLHYEHNMFTLKNLSYLIGA